MTFHFQDDIATNILTIDATDPKSGTAEFKAAAVRIDKLPTPHDAHTVESRDARYDVLAGVPAGGEGK